MKQQSIDVGERDRADDDPDLGQRQQFGEIRVLSVAIDCGDTLLAKPPHGGGIEIHADYVNALGGEIRGKYGTEAS